MRSIKKQFLWRTQKGQMIRPSKMETRHLWFTIRMLWNHSAPPHLQLHPFRHYEFSAFYTVDYVAEAIRVILSQLAMRDDMKDAWKKELRFMYENAPKLMHALQHTPKQLGIKDADI